MSCIRVGATVKANRLRGLLEVWRGIQHNVLTATVRELPAGASVQSQAVRAQFTSTSAISSRIVVGLQSVSGTRSSTSNLVLENVRQVGGVNSAGLRLISSSQEVTKDENNEKKGEVTSYWGIAPKSIVREDGSPWPWKEFQPTDSYVADTSVDLGKHHKPENIGDRIAYWTVKALRLPTDLFFRVWMVIASQGAHPRVKKRYGCRAMMLETVAAVPGMVGGMLLHCKSLRRFEHSGGWIKALLDEAENERMHLMTFMEVAKPKWYERLLVLTVQGIFFNVYFLMYVLSPRTAHRLVGYLEEEAIYSYTMFLKEIDNGNIENAKAPAIAIDYWKLPKDATLRDVVLVVRADEAHHRDVNHYASDIKKEGKELNEVTAPVGYH